MTYSPIVVAARRALLDALEALEAHRDALILVGAHAIYHYTGDTDVAIATETKDSDLVVDPRILADEPTLDLAMVEAGFSHDPALQQPGEWSKGGEIDPPVELLVPKSLHGSGGRRGARIPPHSKHAARSVYGLELAVISYRHAEVVSLEPGVDPRRASVNVASPAALLVSKIHKIRERYDEGGERLQNKDAHDIYRLLLAVPSEGVATDLAIGLADQVANDVTRSALTALGELSESHESGIPTMAGRAEAGVGDPEEVAQRTWALIRELLVLMNER